MRERSKCARRPGRERRSGWNFLPREKRFMPKSSILVVDDEAEIREGLALLLESEGYAVATAETADAGLALLEEQPFDLLLLDVSLPDRSGLDLLPEIHLLDPTLPVVLITAFGSFDINRPSLQKGGRRVTHK